MSLPRVLVTGGAGYIGSHVNKHLNSHGYDTVVLDNLSRGHRDLVKWGNFIEGDIGDVVILEEIFSRYSIGAVVHLAAYAYVEESMTSPLMYWQNNFVQSLALVKQCIKHSVNRFVFSSTCAVYGLPEMLPIQEKQLPKPINPYGATKLAIEMMLQNIAGSTEFKYFALRYFNAAGADLDGGIGERHSPETHLIPKALEAVYNGAPVSVFGDDYKTEDGTCIRDYIHVSDLADGHVKALEHLLEGKDSDTCNLGMGHGFSVGQILNAVERVTGLPLERVIENRRLGDPPTLIANIEKAHNVLGWTPAKLDLDFIVRSAWRWHQREWSSAHD